MNVEESGQALAHLLYFDTLPPELIRNIVRFLSKLPRTEKWATYLYYIDVSGLYSVTGELGKFMLSLCTALRVERKPFTFTLSLKSEPTEAVGCTLEDLFDLSFPQSFTDSIRILDIRYKLTAEEFKLLSEKFPNIEELELSKDDRKESSISDDNSTSIGNIWPNLHHLYLYDLEMYRWDEKTWENLGKNLRTLSVKNAEITTDIIAFVRKSCQELKRLELSGNDEDTREEITKCIVSSGIQLDHVRLFMLADEQLLRVKTACPKARFELVTSELLLQQSVKTVGNELEAVEVYAVDDSEENAREQFDWSACTGIQKSLLYFNATIEDIQRFFNSPKTHLKLVDIYMDGELSKINAAVSLMARSTGRLEEFIFQCKDAAPGMFEELVEANSSLRNVTIALINSARENEVATDIVKTFLKSTPLIGLMVNSMKTGTGEVEIPEIKRICSEQGCRRVCIGVFDVLYLH